MSIRETGQALRVVAFVGMVLSAASLAGCSSLGSFGDVTGSTTSSAVSSGSQSMPPALSTVKVAEGPYIPPANVGGGTGGLVTASPSASSVQSSALPPLTGSTAMPAQSSLAPVEVASTQTLGTLPASAPALTVVPQSGGYYHTIESGESLYTIARRYDVT